VTMSGMKPVSQPQEAPSQLLHVSSPRGRWVLLATIVGSGMSFLDSTVVNVALPAMQRDFGVTLSELTWVIDAYILTVTAFLLLGGSYADLFGRKRTLRLGLIGFTVSSALCGLAPTLLTLDIARALQGLGGALLVPSSLAVLTASFDPSERGRAVGLWASLSGVGAAIGPLAGGLLVDTLSWRWIFLLNVPLGVLVVLIALPHVPESRDEEAEPHLDLAGAALAVIFLAGLTFALIEGPVRGWGNPAVIAGFVASVVGFVAFLVVERRRRQPMVPLEIFRNRTFSAVNAATLAIYFALSGATLFIVLDLQQSRGLSAVAAGAMLLPITVILLLGSPIAGRMADRIGPRLPMSVGPWVAAVGLAVIALSAQIDNVLVAVLPGAIVFSIGLATTVAPLTTAVLSALGAHRAGVASGVNTAVSRFAALVAVAILPAVSLVGFTRALEGQLVQLGLSPGAQSSVLALRGEQGALVPPPGLAPAERAAVEAAVRDAFARGTSLVLGVCAVLLAVGGTIAFVALRDPSSPDVTRDD
jgi:EmrB/QacA subfamily drug resistance transporter